MRLGQFLDATATAKQFVTGKRKSGNASGTHARQLFKSPHTTHRPRLERTWGIPQSEYPLNVGKFAVPVEVPVTPKLAPEVVEGMDDDEGGWVDNEEGIDDELTPV